MLEAWPNTLHSTLLSLIMLPRDEVSLKSPLPGGLMFELTHLVMGITIHPGAEPRGLPLMAAPVKTLLAGIF